MFESKVMDVLPNELLIKVFGYVPYWDLKLSVPLVCKRFKEVVGLKSMTGSIDRALFRDIPAPPHRSSYSSHPLFKHIVMDTGPTSLKMIRYGRHPKTFTDLDQKYTIYLDQTSIVKMEVFNENAISPAVRRAMLHVRDYPARDIIAMEGGVTILDVFRGFVKVLAEVDTLSGSYGYPWTRGKALWYDYHNRFKWNGIDEIKVADGCVHLHIEGRRPTLT